jgi:hypothetical protein
MVDVIIGRLYNWMMMSSAMVSQSTTNWHTIKQLYLQGARLPNPPQPN